MLMNFNGEELMLMILYNPGTRLGLMQDYDAVMDKVAEAEELGLSNRPSTLEKLAELAGTKEQCDAPECNPTVCRKARNGHEL